MVLDELHGGVEVGLVELVGDVPAQRAVLPPLLHRAVEERHAVQHGLPLHHVTDVQQVLTDTWEEGGRGDTQGVTVCSRCLVHHPYESQSGKISQLSCGVPSRHATSFGCGISGCRESTEFSEADRKTRQTKMAYARKGKQDHSKCYNPESGLDPLANVYFLVSLQE